MVAATLVIVAARAVTAMALGQVCAAIHSARHVMDLQTLNANHVPQVTTYNHPLMHILAVQAVQLDLVQMTHSQLA